MNNDSSNNTDNGTNINIKEKKKFKLTFNKIFFSTFIVIWAAATVINLVKPYRAYSENENRFFSSFPAFNFNEMVEGIFMGKVEDFTNEQFILRDWWISAESVLEYMLGKRESNGVFICSDALIGRIAGPKEEYIGKNVEGIEYFVSKIKIPTSLMIVPSASEIQAYKLPIFAQTWSQKDMIDKVYASLGDVACVPVYDALAAHKEEYIYYRTDHHWTTRGAYLAYVKYCETVGLTPAEYKTETVSSSFNGTLYSTSGVRFITPDVIEAFVNGFKTSCDVNDGSTVVTNDSVYFSEYLEKKDKYAYFLGTNQPVVTVYGENGDKPSLLMFKDSYSHCMAPMLLENYSKITLVDLRYINSDLSEYIDIDSYDSALFLFSADTFANQNNIYKLNYFLK